MRKPPPLPVAVAHVAEKLDEDRNGMNGPDTVTRMLAVEGVLIPRYVILPHASMDNSYTVIYCVGILCARSCTDWIPMAQIAVHQDRAERFHVYH